MCFVLQTKELCNTIIMSICLFKRSKACSYSLHSTKHTPLPVSFKNCFETFVKKPAICSLQYQMSIQIERPFTFLPEDISPTVVSGLCDLAAYSELVAKVTDSLTQQNGALEDIRVIIEQNVKDACQWVGLISKC